MSHQRPSGWGRRAVATTVAGICLLLAASPRPVPASPAAPAAARREPPCPEQRYLLDPTLAIGEGEASVVVAGPAAIEIEGLCEPIAPRRFVGARKGTRVRAVWPACAGLLGKVKLKGTIRDGCETLRGKLKARRFKRRLEASRSRCGDGRVDPGAGEQCDPPAAGVCDAECRAIAAATIGPAGGAITSADGRLTVAVPAGALAEETTIAIRRFEGDDVPDELREEEEVDVVYDLAPDGLVFALPVSLALELDAPQPLDDGSFGVDLGLLFLLSDDEETLELLGEQHTVLDVARELAVAHGELTHFSKVFHFFSKGKLSVERRPLARVGVTINPGTVVGVGQGFIPTVTFELSEASLDSPSTIVHVNRTEGPVVLFEGLSEVELFPALLNKGDVAQGDIVTYSCGETPGVGEYRAEVRAEQIKLLVQALPRFFQGFFARTLDARVTTEIVLPITCGSPVSTTTTATSVTTTTQSTSTVTTTTQSTSTSSTSTSTTTTTSTSTSTTSSTSTSTTSSTSTTISGCCQCQIGCASGVAVTPELCAAAGELCTPGAGVFVPAAFCDESGGGTCVSFDTTTTTSTSTTTSTTATTIPSSPTIRQLTLTTDVENLAASVNATGAVVFGSTGDFTGENPAGVFNVFATDLTGAAFRQLSTAGAGGCALPGNVAGRRDRAVFRQSDSSRFCIGSELFVRETDGTGLRQVTNLGTSLFAPWIAPDGLTAAAQCTTANSPEVGGTSEKICLVNVATAEVLRLTELGTFQYCCPSITSLAGGSPPHRVAFATNDQNLDPPDEGFSTSFEIHVAEVGGELAPQALRRLTLTPFPDVLDKTAPRVSEDGSTVAYLRSVATFVGGQVVTRSQLVVADFDGANEVVLTDFDHQAGDPTLTADGSRIAFSFTGDPLGTNPDGNAEIFLVGRDGSGLTQLTVSASGQNLFPFIDPDGHGLVFQSTADLAGANPDGNQEIFAIVGLE